MTIEIVDFPLKNGGSFHSFLYVYQRVTLLDAIENVVFVSPKKPQKVDPKSKMSDVQLTFFAWIGGANGSHHLKLGDSGSVQAPWRRKVCSLFLDGQVHEVAQVNVTCIILNIFYNMDIYGHNVSLDDGSFYLLLSIISMHCTGVLCRWLLSFACPMMPPSYEYQHDYPAW